jgi:hypothetical protein
MHGRIPPRGPGRLAAAAACATLASALLAPASVFASGREPSEYEQYMVELVNRARLDPEGEVARLGTGDLNEGPPTLGGHPYTIPPGPKQPLAVSVFIVKATGDYAELMDDTDTLCHSCLGTDAEMRMWQAGYVPLLSDFDFFDIAGYTLDYGGAQDPSCTSSCPTWVPGRENIAYRAEWPPNGQIDDLLGAIDQAHEDLFNDFGASSRGHRSTLLYGEWKEIGIGLIEGSDDDGTADSLYLVQNYAHRSDTGPFLTGVAYDDWDQDGFYTPGTGEALADVQVTAYVAGTQQPVASTTTMDAGGYNLELPIGVYDVVAMGPGFSLSYAGVAIQGSGPDGVGENTKLDIVPLPEPATTLGLAVGMALLAGSGRARRGD